MAGLLLDVKPSGAKSWILRTTVGTRRTDIGLGGFPEVSLAAAVEAAKQAKAKIKEGIDPTAARCDFSVLYTRAGRLFDELQVAHGDGTCSILRSVAQL